MTGAVDLQLARRRVLGLDPSASGFTGIGVYSLAGQPLDAKAVRISKAGWTERDAIVLLDELIGDAEWIAAIERPFRPRGKRMTVAPKAGEAFWLRVLDLLARERSARAGVRFRKPTILRPQPEQWRGPLGIRTRGLGRTWEERRADVKAAALAWVRVVAKMPVEQPDAAEALCVAAWAARVAHVGAARLGKKIIEVTWSV